MRLRSISRNLAVAVSSRSNCSTIDDTPGKCDAHHGSFISGREGRHGSFISVYVARHDSYILGCEGRHGSFISGCKPTMTVSRFMSLLKIFLEFFEKKMLNLF